LSDSIYKDFVLTASEQPNANGFESMGSRWLPDGALPLEKPVLSDAETQSNSTLSIVTTEIFGSEYYLHDHFPDSPVVPGFVQLQWILDAISFKVHNLAHESAVSVRQMKCIAPIKPRCVLRMTVSPQVPESASMSVIIEDITQPQTLRLYSKAIVTLEPSYYSLALETSLGAQ
jgi:hypothetical protein